jgi:hypothetical protein
VKHELGDALRMRDGVRERQCAAPAAAEDLPPLDAQHAAHLLEVGDEVPRRVLLQLGKWGGVAAAALRRRATQSCSQLTRARSKGERGREYDSVRQRRSPDRQ